MKTGQKLSDTGIDQFVEHYDSYYSIVFSAVYSKVNNYHDAEDICQEVFLRFYFKREEIREPRKWIFGCLRIVVLDYYKSRSRSGVSAEELFDDIGMGYVNGFRDARILIHGALEEVFEGDEEGDAQLFELVAVYGYSFTEASRHLGLRY